MCACNPAGLNRVGRYFMIDYRFATGKDLDVLVRSRLEVLKAVNQLAGNYPFSDDLIRESQSFFENGDHTTVLAVSDGTIIGCGTICYIRVMPTFSHPMGKRARLMNVYTAENFRRQGIAGKMVSMLIEEAWNRGVSEISLDATESGRLLYESLGFVDSEECMVLVRQMTGPN